jgi:hypothetical protein
MAIVGNYLSIDYFQQCGFPGAISTDQANSFPGIDHQIDMVDQWWLTIADKDILQGKE